MKNILLILVCLCVCSNSYGQASQAELEKKRKKFLKKHTSWSWIPQSSFHTFDSVITVGSFYMFKTEITNGQWNEFVDDVSNKNRKKELMPDTTLWNEYRSYEPFAEHYHRHAAYAEYPVVNISYNQAQLFCEWLEKRMNEKEDKDYRKVIIRLPNNSEWTYAAQGGLDNCSYAWGGRYLQNSEGQYLANFYVVSQSSIVYDDKSMIIANQKDKLYSWLDGSKDSPAPVLSFYKNGYGLYCMSGNVSEFVEEENICKGGSWADTGYFLQVGVNHFYNEKESASPFRGFRLVMEVLH